MSWPGDTNPVNSARLRVLWLDPEDLATLRADPVVFPADDEWTECAGPTGRFVMRHYRLDAGRAGRRVRGHPRREPGEDVGTLTVAPLA